jgi:hypothetical protein
VNPERDQSPDNDRTPAAKFAAIVAAAGCVGALVVVIALSVLF